MIGSDCRHHHPGSVGALAGPIGTDATPPSVKNKATSIHRRDCFVTANRRTLCQTVPARAPALPGGPRVTCLRGGHRHGLTHSCVTSEVPPHLSLHPSKPCMITSECRHHDPGSAGALAGPSVQTPRHHLARTRRPRFTNVTGSSGQIGGDPVRPCRRGRRRSQVGPT